MWVGLREGPRGRLASERHQVILSESAAGWVRDFSTEQRHSISKAIAILVEEAIQRRSLPREGEGLQGLLEAQSDGDFGQFLREKFAMDFAIWLRTQRG